MWPLLHSLLFYTALVCTSETENSQQADIFSNLWDMVVNRKIDRLREVSSVNIDDTEYLRLVRLCMEEDDPEYLRLIVDLRNVDIDEHPVTSLMTLSEHKNFPVKMRHLVRLLRGHFTPSMILATLMDEEKKRLERMVLWRKKDRDAHREKLSEIETILIGAVDDEIHEYLDISGFLRSYSPNEIGLNSLCQPNLHGIIPAITKRTAETTTVFLNHIESYDLDDEFMLNTTSWHIENPTRRLQVVPKELKTLPVYCISNDPKIHRQLRSGRYPVMRYGRRRETVLLKFVPSDYEPRSLHLRILRNHPCTSVMVYRDGEPLKEALNFNSLWLNKVEPIQRRYEATWEIRRGDVIVVIPYEQGRVMREIDLRGALMMIGIKDIPRALINYSAMVFRKTGKPFWMLSFIAV